MKVSSQKPGFKHPQKAVVSVAKFWGFMGEAATLLWPCYLPEITEELQKPTRPDSSAPAAPCCGQGKAACTLPPPMAPWSLNGQEKTTAARVGM